MMRNATYVAVKGRIRSDERSAYDIILAMILEKGKDGITQREIILESSLDRTTIYRCTKKLKVIHLLFCLEP
jgi:DNA invertase Pin-like site-specific DNA recombinase